MHLRVVLTPPSSACFSLARCGRSLRHSSSRDSASRSLHACCRWCRSCRPSSLARAATRRRGDIALGAAALFALAIGMCVPLLLVGASAGALLPKAGAWMDLVKRIFGVVLLAVAVWIVQPVLPEQLILALWGALLIAIAAV